MKAIIFDLDGTLVDSARDLQSVANAMLAENDLAPYSLDETKTFIGKGIKNLVDQCLQGRPGPQTPPLEDAYKRVLELYHDAPSAYATLYSGLEQLLPQLNAHGYKLAVCTNKAEDLAIKLLDGMGVTSFFDVIVGARDGQPRKPDPAPVLKCLEALCVDVDDAIYIGDSETDEETANNVGIPFVFFTQGYRKKSTDEFKFAVRLDDFSDFEPVLKVLEAKS